MTANETTEADRQESTGEKTTGPRDVQSDWIDSYNQEYGCYFSRIEACGSGFVEFRGESGLGVSAKMAPENEHPMRAKLDVMSREYGAHVVLELEGDRGKVGTGAHVPAEELRKIGRACIQAADRAAGE